MLEVFTLSPSRFIELFSFLRFFTLRLFFWQYLVTVLYSLMLVNIFVTNLLSHVIAVALVFPQRD